MQQKIILLVLIVIFCFSVPTLSISSCSSCVASAITNGEDLVLTYLIVGFDESAENTDAIILFRYDTGANSASVIQIPRDTYYNFGASQNKINQIYSSSIMLGRSKDEAMQRLQEAVSDAFGIDIDGYAGFTAEAFEGIVDAFGGIDVVLSEDYSYVDGDGKTVFELKKGINHFSGRDAMRFVRFRKGYATADLGRIDAQKLFLSGLIAKIKDGIDFKTVLNLVANSKNGVVSKINPKEILGIVMKKQGRISNAEVKYVTLPGGAVKAESGVWYYSCNKAASERLLSELGFSVTEFDREGRMKNTKDSAFEQIYNDKNIEWKLYTDSTLGSIRLG